MHGERKLAGGAAAAESTCSFALFQLVALLGCLYPV